MDIIKLDEQLEQSLERFSSILERSEESLREANDLKEYFENQTIGLRDAYKKRLEQIEAEHEKDRKAFIDQIKEFDESYAKAVALFEKLEKEKSEYDLMISQMDGMMNKKWSDFTKENAKKHSSFENRINNTITTLKDICDNVNTKLKESEGKATIVIDAFNVRMDGSEKRFDAQASVVEQNITVLNNETEKLNKFTEALEVKIDNDYKYLDQLSTRNTRLILVGFSVTGLLFIILFIGWLLK